MHGKELEQHNYVVSGAGFAQQQRTRMFGKEIKNKKRQGNFKIHVHSFNYFFIIFTLFIAIPKTNITDFAELNKLFSSKKKKKKEMAVVVSNLIRCLLGKGHSRNIILLPYILK